MDPTIERDGRDADALHVAVRDGALGDVIATGRILVQGDVAKVQRVAVALERRGTGAGRLVMDGLESRAADQGARQIALSSQREAIAIPASQAPSSPTGTSAGRAAGRLKSRPSRLKARDV